MFATKESKWGILASIKAIAVGAAGRAIDCNVAELCVLSVPEVVYRSAIIYFFSFKGCVGPVEVTQRWSRDICSRSNVAALPQK